MKTKRSYVMTSRAAKSDETRAPHRKSAAALYFERPLEDFTIEEVAERAGVAVRTVLRAFPTKNELVLAALWELAPSGVRVKPTPAGDARAAVAVTCDLYEAVGDLILRQLEDEHRRPA